MSIIQDIAKRLNIQPKPTIIGFDGKPVKYLSGEAFNRPVDYAAPADNPPASRFALVAPPVSAPTESGREIVNSGVGVPVKPSVIQSLAASIPAAPDVSGREMTDSGIGVAMPSAVMSAPDVAAPRVPYKYLSLDDKIADDQSRYADLQANRLPEEKSIWKRLGRGLLQGASNYNPQTGLGGLLGALAGGAVIDAVSPKTEAAQRTNAELAKVGQRLQTNYGIRAQQNQADANSLKNQKEQIELQGAMLKNRNQVIANANDAGKREYETLTAKDYVTPQEAADYTTRYGIAISPYDARKYSGMWNNGTYVATPEKGAPSYNPVRGVADDPTAKPYNVKIGDETIPLTPKQYAPIKQASIERQADRDQQQNQFETRTTIEIQKENAARTWDAIKENAKSRNNWYSALFANANEIAGKTGNVIANAATIRGFANQRDALQAQLDSITGTNEKAVTRANKLSDDIAKLNAQIETELGKTEAGSQAIQQLQDSRPPAPSRLVAPQVKVPNFKNTSKGGKNQNIGTQADFRKVLSRIN